MRKKILEELYKAAKKNKKIVFIGSDLGPDILKNFKKDFPDRFFMEGAAEQNLISSASGMAHEGFIPYVNTIASFLTRRCYEQIYINLGMHKSKVRLIANGGGVVYAPLGPTHLALDDISLLKNIPNMTILVPADSVEVSKMMRATINHNGPIYFRIAKGGDPISTEGMYKKFKIGKPYKIGKEYKNIIVSTGVMLDTALKIRKELNSKKKQIGIVHCPTIKPLDSSEIKKIFKKTVNVITIEEHGLIGGLGSTINDFLKLEKNKKITNLGFPDSFVKGYGRQHEMLKKYNLDFSGILKKIKKII